MKENEKHSGHSKGDKGATLSPTPPPAESSTPKGDQVKPESSADMLKKVLSKMNNENTGAGKIKGMDLAICKIEEALAYIEGRQDLPENIK